MKGKIFHYLLALFLPLLIVQCTVDKATGIKREAYFEKLGKERADKNSEMAHDSLSPLAQADRKDFKGLNYYPVKPAYRVVARFEKDSSQLIFKMKTTTSRLPEYRVFGKVYFKLQGEELTLNVYQNLALSEKEGYHDYLFIPFNDLTNDVRTYAGGRFLDTHIPEGNTLIIDFNEAYNPYCAYNHKYSCPIPPSENFLKIKLKAGEKDWNSPHEND
jgi:uncharacterized protein